MCKSSPKIIGKTKQCHRCKEFKDFNNFYKDTSVRCGLGSWCKKCISEVEHPNKIEHIIDDKRLCNICKEYKDFSEFTLDNNTKCKLSSYCKECLNYGNTNDKNIFKDGFKNHLKRRYNLELDVYIKMLHEQDNKCAICKQPETAMDHRNNVPKRLSLDHNHETGEVRRLLCCRCNTIIGFSKENPELLRDIALYIEDFKQNWQYEK